MRYRKDDDDEEQEVLRKKKKKRFPFHAKVGGRISRRRADRYRGGGAVASAADGEMESPNVPNAPKGGAVKQKFQEGGPVEEAQRRKMDVNRRQRGEAVVGPEDFSGRKMRPEQLAPFGGISSSRRSPGGDDNEP